MNQLKINSTFSKIPLENSENRSVHNLENKSLFHLIFSISEIRLKIFSFCSMHHCLDSFSPIKSINYVNKSFNNYSIEGFVDQINEKPIRLDQCFFKKTPKEVINFLSKKKKLDLLRHATTFSGGLGMDCLETISNSCSNLESLHLSQYKVLNNHWNYFSSISHLRELELNFIDCKEEPDLLKLLLFTKQLSKLHLAYCRFLKSDTMDHLSNTPKLTILRLCGSSGLAQDSLKYLKHTPELEKLDIHSIELEPDALKHLEKTNRCLKSISIEFCKLEEDAIKHLKNTPLLEYLLVRFKGNSTQHLENTQLLQSLIIYGSSNLQPDSLKHLKYTPFLKSLKIFDFPSLENAALEHLANTPLLEELTIGNCPNLESDAFQNLKNTPCLNNLTISQCPKLEYKILEHLNHTPRLTHLNIYSCAQLSDLNNIRKMMCDHPSLVNFSIFKEK